tara:strand:- start:464 stop:1168 length:705 start_codon:yes stop_codon:yes gene_type:complete
MRQSFTLLFLVSLAVSIPAVTNSDEPESSPEPSATIPLEDSPTTVDAALKRLSAKTGKLDDRLAEIQEAHEKAVNEAKTETIGYLKTIARDFASQGEIAEATKAWTEVIKLDADNEDAKEYLKAIGRLDVVQKQVITENADDYSRKRRVKFVTTFHDKTRVFEKKGLVWLEMSPGRKTYTHSEIHRDPAMVIIQRDDGYEHALLPSGFIYGNKEDRTGTGQHIWRDGNKGYWER